MHCHHLLLWQYDKRSVMMSWHHPQSGHWHQLDLIFAWCHQIQHVKHTTSLHSMDCETDHTLVHMKIQITIPKKAGIGTLYHKPKKKRFNTLNMKDCMLVNQFEKELGGGLDVLPPTSPNSDSWNSLHDVIYNKVVETFGSSDKRIPLWFKAHIGTIGLALDQKRMARLPHVNQPSMENLDKLKIKCASVQCIMREAQMIFWEDICHKVQNYDD